MAHETFLQEFSRTHLCQQHWSRDDEGKKGVVYAYYSICSYTVQYSKLKKKTSLHLLHFHLSPMHVNVRYSV